METSLQSAFHQPNLFLTRRPQRNCREFTIRLRDGRDAEADDGVGQQVQEVLTREGKPTSFYFGVVANFDVRETASGHALRHATLIVFNDICGGELTSLFRAEWDEKAALSAESEHAQPHWHFVQSPARIEGIVRNYIGMENKFVPDQKSELFIGPDCGRFHFAMAPLWNDKIGSPSYKQVFGADDFRKWFRSLTSYVAGQIDYLLDKAPPQVEFSPSKT
jgi:hypothetical protein